MKKYREISNRKIVRLTILFYLLLCLAEFISKIIAVYVIFSGHKITSSLANRVSEGVRILAPSILVYILSLILIYVIFALMNGHYTILLSSWLKQRFRKLAKSATAISFLLVNGLFLAGVYGVNAARYPASDQAFLFKGLIGQPGNAGTFLITALVILGIYLLGFVVLNFRLSPKPALIASMLVCFVLLVAPLDPTYYIKKALMAQRPSANRGPNIIFIGIDSLNPRHTGYFGYPLPITPHIDEFLRENIVFENAYTPIARTFPSWYSILTGQYPITNGVRLNLMKRKYIKSVDQCLGNVLKPFGYATCFITDEVRFSNITAEEGYDILRHPPIGIKDFLFGSFHDFSLTNVFFNNPLGYLIFPFSDINRAVAHVYDGRYFVNDVLMTLDHLKKEEKFFLTAHLCAAHWPYTHASPREFSYKSGADANMALYDSAVHKVDNQFGRIIKALKEGGLYDNSVIVVLSDHGESHEGHGSNLRDSEQNRILLAIKPLRAGRHRDLGRLVRSFDIAPTVLDILGHDVSNRPYDGISLKPWIIDGQEPDKADSESVIMETEFSLDTPGGIGLALQSMIEQGVNFYEFDKSGRITVRDDYHNTLIRRRNRAILTPEWILIHDVMIRGDVEKFKSSLYNVHTDPHCKEDVLTEQPAVFQELLERLMRYYGPELILDTNPGVR